MNFVDIKLIKVMIQMGTFLPRVYQDDCSPSVCSDDFVGKSNDFVVYMRVCSYIGNMLCISMKTVLIYQGYVESVSDTVPGYDFVVQTFGKSNGFDGNSFWEQLPMLYWPKGVHTSSIHFYEVNAPHFMEIHPNIHALHPLF